MSLIVSSAAAASPGFVFETASGSRSDVLEFEQVVYTGMCPGSELSPVRGYYVDPDQPTGGGRRVKIVNVTQGMDSDPYPYTDRDYSSAGRSEKIDFYPGSEHRRRWFSVADGINDFEVTLTQGQRVIETKRFSFPVVVKMRSEPRVPTCRIEPDCRPTPPNGGVICTPRTVCSCPWN